METHLPDLREVKNILEAAILASPEPLGLQEMQKLLGGGGDLEGIRRLIEDIRGDWAGRGLELVAVAGGWRFQTRPQMQIYLDRISGDKPPKYSRAVLETLAIIAYRQPVTRGDIEDIRGVGVSPGILKALEGRGWIDAVGHREAPGRPALYATTPAFLNDLGLRSLQELPSLDDLGALVDQSARASMDISPIEPNVIQQESNTPVVESHAESISALTQDS